MTRNGSIAIGLISLLIVGALVYYAVMRYEHKAIPLATSGRAYTQAEVATMLQDTCEALPEEQQEQCRESKQELLLSGQCDKLDAVTAKVCNDLYSTGTWPRPLNVSVNPMPLVPSNFADQEEANEPVPWRHYVPPQTVVDGSWTLDLDSSNGIDDAAPYQSHNHTQTTRENYWNPVSPIALRSQLQEWQLVEPLPLM